jgi:hypothetical protein
LPKRDLKSKLLTLRRTSNPISSKLQSVGVMDKNKPGSANGKERRSGVDRRKVERRDPKRNSETGTLSTRTGERRQETRRKNDPK